MSKVEESVMLALLAFLGLLVFIPLIGVLLAVPVYYLWNGCLVGAVSGVAPITLLQAWGLNVLCSFLFKSTKFKSE